MRSLRWLAPGALLSLVACGSVDRDALSLAGADAGAQVQTDLGPSPAADTGTPTVNTDTGNPVTPPPLDAGGPSPPLDAGGPPPPLDAGGPPPPLDAGGLPPPLDAGPPPPRDAGPPPPRDTGGPTCTACTAFAPVAFCPGSGAGTCLSYAGCSAEGCATCASALAGGDNCDNPILITSTGRRRTVVSTCGARNDVTTGCNGRGGPDIVIGLRVARRGQVIARLTVPAGVSVNYGYDFPARACHDDAVLRPCGDNTTSTTQGFDLTLDPGTYYLYVATTVASTIVVDTTLP
jgi:hypothetical protein